ncbi:unnamed protein product [Spirodela intermedia]|uniref:Uncharacterized protein n=2 Tax=Spirodela intermedia TaxID=51605 RepID=A0A7I8J866_SPIIN|nr:unnamed protein product [Spirodela intermedia]CAA6665935.1 unnamed protein product [Spirodela intermedia]CAA7402693.1 unnamed protein product [Spirodela intermedia]
MTDSDARRMTKRKPHEPRKDREFEAGMAKRELFLL